MGHAFLKASQRILFVVFGVGLVFISPEIFSEEGHSDDKHDEHEAGEKHGEEKGHDHGHEETSSKFGAGKAIVAVREEGNSFQLSEESSKFLGLKFARPQEIKAPKGEDSTPFFEIPAQALVSFQAEHGVYIREGVWIELVEVKVVKRNAGKIVVKSDDLKIENEIAVEGTSFLRAAHLDASGQGGEGHAH